MARTTKAAKDELAQWEAERSKLDHVKEAIGDINDLFILNDVYRAWETRMKDLAAAVLKPGSEETITSYSGGLDALDYIWRLQGDRSFNAADKEPPKYKALDYYVGRKVEHIWGTGVLVKMKEGYGIRVRLACGTTGCRNRITVYARPGCHTGAFCYMYDANGRYLADLRNQTFACRRCAEKS